MNRSATSKLCHNRAVHLLDAENLIGAPALTALDVSHLRDIYLAHVPVGPMDQIIIASAHNSTYQIGVGWPGNRYTMRSGKDGADICLAEIILSENLHVRFAHVYLGSGDGGLAPFAALLAERHVYVTAVARRGSLSARMRMAARDLIYIDQTAAVSALAA